MFDKIGKSKFMKIVLFITTFAFVGTGIVAIILYKIFGGISGAVAVNGEEISFAEINFRVNQIRAKLGAQGIDPDVKNMEKEILKIAVLQAIDEELLYQEAKREGITATKEEVKKYILDMDLFKENGKFSKEKYIQFLQSFGISAQLFEEIVEKKLSVLHLYSFIDLGSYITNDEIKALTFVRNASISGKVLVINSPDINITDEELKKYYEKNKDKFKLKEGKKIVLYKLDFEKLGKENAIKKAKEIYNALKENKNMTVDNSLKFYEGVYKDDINIPENLKKKINELGKDKNILFVKTDKSIYVGKYLGEGYKYPKFEEVKNNLKDKLISEKKNKILKEIYSKLEKIYKIKNLEEISKEFNGQINEFKDKLAVEFALNYSINPINLEKIINTGKYLLIAGDKVIVLKIDNVKFDKENNEEIAKLKPLFKNIKKETIIKMYIDKLKENSEIEINPILREKLKL